MFDIGWSELLVIGVVAIIVVGPKELPRLMRTFGHYLGKVRHMAADFQRQFEDAACVAALGPGAQFVEARGLSRFQPGGPAGAVGDGGEGPDSQPSASARSPVTPGTSRGAAPPPRAGRRTATPGR